MRETITTQESSTGHGVVLGITAEEAHADLKVILSVFLLLVEYSVKKKSNVKLARAVPHTSGAFKHSIGGAAHLSLRTEAPDLGGERTAPMEVVVEQL